MIIDKDLDSLEISDKTDIDEEVELEVRGGYDPDHTSIYITEQDAVSIIEHFMDVFNMSSFEIHENYIVKKDRG